MATYLFDISWEVCNRLGDISAVLASKARTAVKHFGDHYLMIGPLLEKNNGFTEEAFEGADAILRALAQRKITAKAGRWSVPGTPRCLLVDYRAVIGDQEKLFYHLWENFGVDSMFGGWDYIEPVLYSTVYGMTVETVVAHLPEEIDVCAHFHEWSSGAGLLYVKKNVPRVSTVLTAYSTVLGRAIAGAGGDIYMVMDEIDAAQEAKRYGVAAKYSMESVCARHADCFAAVSQLAANECLALLGVNPSTVTPYALDLGMIPEYGHDSGAHAAKRTFLLDFASRFLGRDLKPATTRFIAVAGRPEFQGRGIDLFLESLSALDQRLRAAPGSQTTVVALLLLQGGALGVHEEALRRIQKTVAQAGGAEDLIATHRVAEGHGDPVLSACKHLGLLNRTENRCCVIVIPATLDGADGLVNASYHDILAGCDLGVFPSNYEPCAHVPMECAAYGVPVVTTDRSAFGEWALEHCSNKPGVFVLERQGRSLRDAAADLTSWLAQAVTWDNARLVEWKCAARAIVAELSWDRHHGAWLEAYQKAELARQDRMTGMRKQSEEAPSQTLITPTNTNQPRLRPFSVVSELPKELKMLEEIAYSLWWVWNRDARELYKRLDPVVWEHVASNPVALLQQVAPERLDEARANQGYMQLYESVTARYKAAMQDTACRITELAHVTHKNPVAYFSMEFGLHESMPIYSGGLGILSGDHLKSASELHIPMVGVGLLYKFGYFVQRVNKAGEQVPLYEENNFALMPVRPATRAGGQRVKTVVELPGRKVFAQVWVAQVGSVPLYLLDTDVDENSQKDRFLTSKLYDSSTRERIEQEILLGIGGVTALRLLSIEPSVYHLNEGHSAFLLVEQLRLLIKEKNLDFDTAREVVRSRSVFTTHTPVPAGNERFHRSLIEHYFRSYVEQCGITWEQFWNLGHIYAGEESDFEMTVLALKLCSRYNGVSRLHGQVARTMWQQVWRGFLPEEIPIGHITNGVHCGSWIADDMRNVLETYAGILSEKSDREATDWDRVNDVPANVLWQAHNALKNRLFEHIRQTVQAQWNREGEDPHLLELFHTRLNPGAFTIGFARRIATYKRPLLLLKDIERLRRLVTHEKYPVQVVFAGKAHPADREAAALIKEIVRVSKEPDFLGRIVFLEGYNIRLARALVSGVDLWLNNPVRPMEASGTSGMKAAMNGVVNCSILDGWWDECYREDPECGWAIGQGVVLENREAQDTVDAENLYDVLEKKVIPTYYNRNTRGIPEQWIQRMKRAMIAAFRRYNTDRMLYDYATQLYEPAAHYSLQLAKNDYAKARTLAEWKKKLPGRFTSMSLREVRIDGLQGNLLNIKGRMRVGATVQPEKMRPSELRAELVIQEADGAVTVVPMSLRRGHGTLLIYEAEFSPPRTGQFKYGVRVVPTHPDLVCPLETGLVAWG